MNIRRLSILLVVSLIALSSTVYDAEAQWVQTAGPYGGTIYTMAVLGPNTSHPLLFAGAVSGIFRSTDSGAQWVNVTSGLSNTDVGSFAVMDTDIFAVTTGGILRSTNGGTAWRLVNNGLSGNLAQSIATMGTDLFVATYNQIFRSSNRGASWLAVDSIPGPNSGYNNVNAFASIGTSLFVATSSGLFRSLDSGASWMDIGSGLNTGNGISSLAVGGMNGSPALLYAGYGSTIFLSTDSGTTWNPTSTPAGYFELYTLGASGSDLYAGTDYGFYSSSDQGQTWDNANYDLAATTVETIAVMDTARGAVPATLFVGTFTGIFASTNGGANWLPANTGVIISDVTSFAVLGPDVFAGTNNNLFLSSDDGGSWQPLAMNSNGSQTTGGVSALATDGQALFAATPYGSGILVSNDSGVTWANPSSNSYYNFSINTLFPEVGSFGTTLFGGTSSGIFQSPDEGATWIDASTGLFADELAAYSFAQHNGDLYCGTQYGGVFYSSDSGKTWNDISPATTASQESYIQALAVSGTTLFAGMNDTYGSSDGGVLQSSDNGANWKKDYGVTGNVAALLTIGPNVFAATDAGIFLSTNRGMVWSDAGEGMNGAAINALAIRGSELYAGTTGAGVWRRPLAEMIDVSSVAQNQSLTTTAQNYPNPFTTQTTIPFSLSHSGHVSVKIFDMLGNEVATLANQDMGAGPHEAVWNAGAQAPGMYACQIATLDGVQTLPLIRTK